MGAQKKLHLFLLGSTTLELFLPARGCPFKWPKDHERQPMFHEEELWDWKEAYVSSILTFLQYDQLSSIQVGLLASHYVRFVG
jgi:hypothetical protein